MLPVPSALAKVKWQPASAGSFGNAECSDHLSIRAFIVCAVPSLQLMTDRRVSTHGYRNSQVFQPQTQMRLVPFAVARNHLHVRSRPERFELLWFPPAQIRSSLRVAPNRKSQVRSSSSIARRGFGKCSKALKLTTNSTPSFGIGRASQHSAWTNGSDLAASMRQSFKSLKVVSRGMYRAKRPNISSPADQALAIQTSPDLADRSPSRRARWRCLKMLKAS